MSVLSFGVRLLKTGFVKLMQKTTNLRPYREYLAELATFPVGTVGREVAGFMRRHNFEFIPRFSDHDLKHVLLGYGVSVQDEFRMQAFMLGNGNYSPACVLFLLPALLMPSLWKTLLHDFREGRKSLCIVNFHIEDVAHMPLGKMQHFIYSNQPINPGKLRLRK